MSSPRAVLSTVRMDVVTTLVTVEMGHDVASTVLAGTTVVSFLKGRAFLRALPRREGRKGTKISVTGQRGKRPREDLDLEVHCCRHSAEGARLARAPRPVEGLVVGTFPPLGARPCHAWPQPALAAFHGIIPHDFVAGVSSEVRARYVPAEANFFLSHRTGFGIAREREGGSGGTPRECEVTDGT